MKQGSPNCLLAGRVLLVVTLILLPLSLSAKNKVKVVVTILPQAYLVERIGGERVEVNVLVGPGQSHETYEPTPKQIAELAEAELFFRIGVPVEASLVRKISAGFEHLKIVDMRKGLHLRLMTEDELAGEHAVHHRENADSAAYDPHIWLDPKMALVQATTICEELATVDPSNEGFYRDNLRSVKADLEALDSKISALLAPYRGETFYVFHPAFGYFADSYGLKQAAVEVEGKEPTARQLSELIERAKREQVKAIFVQPQFSRKGAESIAKAIDGRVVAIDPLAKDYLGNLEEIASRIAAAFHRDE